MGPATKTTKPSRAGRMNRNPKIASCLRKDMGIEAAHDGKGTGVSMAPIPPWRAANTRLFRAAQRPRYFFINASLTGLLIASDSCLASMVPFWNLSHWGVMIFVQISFHGLAQMVAARALSSDLVQASPPGMSFHDDAYTWSKA